MAGDRNWDAPPKGRKGLPDTCGNAQPSMAPTARASGAAKGATNCEPNRRGQASGPPTPSHRANKDGV